MPDRRVPLWFPLFLAIALHATGASAQTASIAGTVGDETGGALPGVAVELRWADGMSRPGITNAQGAYRFDGVPAGDVQVAFTLINFAPVRRNITVSAAGSSHVDVTLHLSLSAEVAVTGKRTFTNLADVERPAENLVGIALSASQGAITARQLDTRPVMRTGEVLETVPGVVISQHSGEGKANQYYLRGFNLDHGTDFATTVAGMPVNMPTHAHGHGYSDLNFLIPELVSGVQFSKGPYFADQGDFATAGAANINYVTSLDRTIVRITGGQNGYGRALAAASARVASGRLLTALDVGRDDGPWLHPDNFKRINAVVRYSRGDTVNEFSITGMGYRATWNATDQIPQRAVGREVVDRFGTLDPTDGGETYRYSGSVEWQRTRGNAATNITAYGIGYDLNLFSNFTFFLNDAVRGDQFEQADHRFVSGLKVSHRRIGRWGRRPFQNTFGAQLRSDNINRVALYHTEARRRLETTRQDAVLQTSGGIYAQSEVEWGSWLRTLAGVRADAYRFRVDPAVASAGIVSPKGGVVIGPFHGTELYVNGGFGFHSHDARVVTMTRATPLARAKGAEVGLRTVAFPRLQSSVSVWSLSLASELVFVGDAATTETSSPSHRYGVEWANYYHPRAWLTFDGDVSLSRARFTGVAGSPTRQPRWGAVDPAGDRIPGSVESVVSLGATIDAVGGVFGSARLRYFGPRPLVEDDSVRAKATSLVNLEAGYKLTRTVRIALDVFNLLNATQSDVDYYYRSRLRGEPAGGIDDIHFHPALPRTARVQIQFGF